MFGVYQREMLKVDINRYNIMSMFIDDGGSQDNREA